MTEAAVADAVARARELRRLHLDPAILVLVNVWDVASARTVASVPGCRAIATASWAIAAAHGLADGEAIGRERMIELVGEIAAAVPLPVTADLEGGYGATPADVGETVARAIAAGAVGCNLEDGVQDGQLLRDAQDAAERVAAVRERAVREGVPVVVNARTESTCAARTIRRRRSCAARPMRAPAPTASSCPGCATRRRSPRWSTASTRRSACSAARGAVGPRAAGARRRARLVRPGADGCGPRRAGAHGVRPARRRRAGRRAVIPPAGRLTLAQSLAEGPHPYGAPEGAP